MERFLVVKIKNYDAIGIPIEEWIIAERDINGIYEEIRKTRTKKAAFDELEKITSK